MQILLTKPKVSGFKICWKTRSSDERRKYLVFDLEQGRFSWASTFSEPSDKNLHPAAQILRKYTESVHIERLAMLENQIILEVTKDGGKFFFVGARDHFELINDKGESYFRWSKKGFFSKRKNTDLPKEHLLQPFDLELFDAQEIRLKKETQDILPPLQRLLRDRLARRRKTLSKAFEKQKKLLPQPAEIKQTQDLIDFFSENFAEQNFRQAQEHFPNFAFDPTKSWGQHLDQFHRQLKKKIKAVNEPHIAKAAKELQDVEQDLEKVRSDSLSGDAILRLARQHRINLDEKKKSNAGGQSKVEKDTIGRKFLSRSGAEIFVARSAEEGDLLVKQARANDFWFHVVTGTGGHVIVRRKSLADKMLDTHTLRDAMILAVHFSGHAATRSAEVYTAEKSGLRKRKNAPAGLWEIVRASSLMVKYEKEELDEIFNQPMSA